MKAKSYGKESLSALESEKLIQGLVEQAEYQFKTQDKPIPILEWARGIVLTGGTFDLENHPWQKEILESDFPVIVMKKAAQIGATAVFILKVLYNLVFGRYRQGAMVVMPTVDSAISYSKSRFAPLIEENDKIGGLVTSTDSATLKRVKKSFLHFVGGQLTSSLEKGLKKSSTALKSTPVDVTLVDELDEISPKALDLAKERISHSKVKHEFFLSTPTIPNYGIDRLYQESDQRVWMIRCEHCGHESCLELEFPNSLIETVTGVIRACSHCKKEIFPSNGRWVAQVPQNTDMKGYWISQLCSPFVEPKAILKAFRDGENIQEFYNSKLGMAYITSENKLNISDVMSACGQDVMSVNHRPPACAGVDIGKLLHLTIAIRPSEKVLKVIYVGRLSSFGDVTDVCARLGVCSIVCDVEPETRAVRAWQSENPRFGIFLCDYIASALGGPRWNEEQGLIQINRTECLDATHYSLTTPGRIILPRRNSEIDEFAKELTSMARVIEENELGERRYVWRALGADHYAHSFSYCLLAAQRIGFYEEVTPRKEFIKFLEGLGQKQKEEKFNPWRGLNIRWD